MTVKSPRRSRTTRTAATSNRLTPTLQRASHEALFCYAAVMPINTDPHVHKIVICANVFIRRGGQYLVLRRSPHKRYAPGVVHPVGGKVDANEDPLTAARREAREEAGVEVSNVRLGAVITEIAPPPDNHRNWQIFHFVADYASGDVTRTDEGELLWLTAEEFKQEQLFPTMRAVVDQVLDPSSGPAFARIVWQGDQVSEAAVVTLVS
jgi:8-oxo-dGTP diphosphatase